MDENRGIRTPEEDKGLEPRCPVVILLDRSGSMYGEPMSQVNGGIKLLFDDLSKDPLAARRCEVAIISFGGTVKTELDFTVVSQLQDIPQLTADGETPMGEAITLACSFIKSKKQAYAAENRTYYRPWIFLLTDGMPTDMQNIPQATQKVHDGEKNGNFLFFAVGCYSADMKKLADIAPPNRPPLYLQNKKFSEMFEWLSKSIISVSSSKIGDQAGLPPTTGWGTAPTS